MIKAPKCDSIVPIHTLCLDTLTRLVLGSKDFKYWSRPMGIQYVVEYQNGYQASIINYGSGSEDGFFEVAVLIDGKLCYDTEVTNDVVSPITEQEVLEICLQIKGLEPPRS